MKFPMNPFLFLFLCGLILFSIPFSIFRIFKTENDARDIQHLKYEISCLKLDIAGLKTIIISNLLKTQNETNQRMAPKPEDGE